MSFMITGGSDGKCSVGIVPNKFELLPKQSNKVGLILPQCFKGAENTPGITIYGWPSKLPNAMLFQVHQ